MTKTLITISIELWELLRDGKFNKIEEDDLKTLISEHFVVPEELDELTEHNNHNMTHNCKNERFRMDDILSIAYSYNILNHEEIYHQVLSSVSNLNDILRKNGVSKKLSDNICKRVSKI